MVCEGKSGMALIECKQAASNARDNSGPARINRFNTGHMNASRAINSGTGYRRYRGGSCEGKSGMALIDCKRAEASARDNSGPARINRFNTGHMNASRAINSGTGYRRYRGGSSLKRGKGKCVKQTTKKYKTRPSPAFPANMCKGKKKLGNDKKYYLSKKNKKGVYTWKKMSKTVKNK